MPPPEASAVASNTAASAKRFMSGGDIIAKDETTVGSLLHAQVC